MNQLPNQAGHLLFHTQNQMIPLRKIYKKRKIIVPTLSKKMARLQDIKPTRIRRTKVSRHYSSSRTATIMKIPKVKTRIKIMVVIPFINT